MQNKFFFWMAVLFILPILPSSVLAQDPGMPDTVRFNSGNLPAYRGHSCIPVYFTADEPILPDDSLVGIMMPLRWYPLSPNCQPFFLDSVSWVHSEPPIRNGQHFVNVDNQNQFAGISTIFQGLGPTQNGIICEICFSYPPEESCTNEIDTTFWPPDNRLSFVTKDGRQFFPQFVSGEYHLSSMGWYWKPSYEDYAPSGMPDFDQKQDNWLYPFTDQWTLCGPVAVANCFWWFDSKHNVPPGMPADGFDQFPLVRDYEDNLPPYAGWVQDDHDMWNVNHLDTPWPPPWAPPPPTPQPFVPGYQNPPILPMWGELVERLAWFMNTDDIQGTGSGHIGTRVPDMQSAIDEWLSSETYENGSSLADSLYEVTIPQPTFAQIESLVEISEDVILLLGFWYNDGGSGEQKFVRGDIDADGISLTISDLAACINGPPFPCDDAADINDDGIVDSVDCEDLAYFFTWGIFPWGDPFAPLPFPGCGTDPTPDGLGCASFPPCPGDGEWWRVGGHYVTVAGVNSEDSLIAISDPFVDWAELGNPGRVLDGYFIPHSPPPHDPIEHNDAGNISHDIYRAESSLSPGGLWALRNYPVSLYPELWTDNFNGQNIPDEFIPVTQPWNGVSQIYTEVEYAVAISPHWYPPKMVDWVHSRNTTMAKTNHGQEGQTQIIAPSFVWHEGEYLYGPPERRGGGSIIIGNDATNLALSYGIAHQDFAPSESLKVDTARVDGMLIEYATAKYRPHLEPPGLEVTMIAVGFMDTLFGGGEAILQEFIVENQFMEPVDFHFSLFLDWQVGDPLLNLSHYDSLYNYYYQYSTSVPNEVVGVMRIPDKDTSILKGFLSVDNYTYINPQDGWRKDSLWSCMNRGTWDNSAGPTDLSALLTSQPFTLESGEKHLESYWLYGYSMFGDKSGDPFERFLFHLLKLKGYYRGDVNCDGVIDIGDVVYLINYLFKGGPAPLPFADQGDVNISGVVDIGDVVYLINYLYKNGSQPIDYDRWLYYILMWRWGISQDEALQIAQTLSTPPEPNTSLFCTRFRNLGKFGL